MAGMEFWEVKLLNAEELKAAANSGDIIAQYTLACYFISEDNEFIQKSRADGEYWFEQAARQNVHHLNAEQREFREKSISALKRMYIRGQAPEDRKVRDVFFMVSEIRSIKIGRVA